MVKKASKEIVAYCSSCKLDLDHIIVALDGEKIKKVLCKTCDKEHVYKAPKGEKAPPKKKKAKAKTKAKTKAKPKKKTRAKAKKKTISPFEEWEKAMEQVKDAPSVVYAQDGSFGVGEKVDHSKFGQGLITKLIQPNKMEVIFEEGTKLMIRGSS
jgi:hypothetical protein